MEKEPENQCDLSRRSSQSEDGSTVLGVEVGLRMSHALGVTTDGPVGRDCDLFPKEPVGSL